MLNGILIVKKEKDFTSNDVVAKLRGICRQKKIGHTGTLDPNAEGVLPVCLGNATKLCDMLTDRSKEYVAEMTLGITSDTQDIWGRVLSDSGDKWQKIPMEEIERTILSFQGKQMQIPPMYSALKINGKRLYELARAGVEVERKPRQIEIEEIEIMPSADFAEKKAHQTACFLTEPRLRIRVVCSKGTYIRTLCQDIGERLGCGAVMSSLMRTRVGNFVLKKAHTLPEIEKIRDGAGIESILVPVDFCFQAYPAFQVTQAGERFLRNGNELKVSVVEGNGVSLREAAEGDPFRVYDRQGRFCGVYVVLKKKGVLKPWKMFLP